MREQIRDNGRLEHILGAIDDALGFVKEASFDDMKNNKMLYYAVVHSVQIIGEAAYMLSKEFKSSHPEIEWRLIEGMRHVIVHDYYNVRPLEVWNIVKDDLPRLRKQIEALVK
jgi:uncharacterized protein with HEPN domain